VACFDDPVFGKVKVAIAEKINESARGTARNGAVREHVEALRERASRAAGHHLELPFAVLVQAANTLPVPAAEAIAVEEAIAAGDLATAQGRLLAVVQRAIKEPKRADIFNNGVACSDEALDAYLGALGPDSLALAREVPVVTLHGPLQDRYYFPKDPLKIVAVLDTSSGAMKELFVYQGRAVFRGFEATGGLGVYELIDPASPLFAALEQVHVPAWLRE